MRQIKLLTLVLLVSLSMNAQGRREEVKQKIESKKIAFLTTQLNLTPESSQIFWPLYNAYNEENVEINKSFIRESKDDSAEVQLENSLLAEENKLAIKRKYISKFKDAIGAEKTLQFFRFDRQFKEKMLREIGNKRTRMGARGK